MHFLTSQILSKTRIKYSKIINYHRMLPLISCRKQFSDHQILLSKSTQLKLDNCKVNVETLAELKDIISLCINEKTFKFPSIWLRDNCQCSACFQNESQSRTINWGNFDFETKPLNVTLEASKLIIEWSDHHRSTFALEWLIERSFSDKKRKLFRDKLYRFERVTWGAKEFKRYLEKFDYNIILNEDSVLLKWLESLTKYGVAIVTDVPAEHDSSKILSERVAFTRKTHYGEQFIVRAKDNANNVAYCNTNLQLHTDLPYYHYTPGVNLLHCLVQSQGQGGESHLTDGFHVVNYLKINHPEEYKILTKTLVDWSDVGHENGNYFHSLYQAPILCEDEFKDVVRINYSQPQRDSHFNAPIEQITPWYKAAGLFTKLLHSPENTVAFKLTEGEILTFDNFRMVHGRSAYKEKVGRERLIVGCYLDWDEIYSRMRVLRNQFK